MILKSHQHYTVMGERGRAGGRLLPPVPCNPGSRSLFSWLYPFFSISKYWPLLRNCPHFSLFSCRGGGRDVWGRWCRGPNHPPPKTLHSWLPYRLPWFLTSRAFAIAKNWTLYCCVISPISLASIHNKEFLPPVLPSLTSLFTFLLDSHNPLLPHDKWFNIKLLVSLCCSFTIIQKKT